MRTELNEKYYKRIKLSEIASATNDNPSGILARITNRWNNWIASLRKQRKSNSGIIFMDYIPAMRTESNPSYDVFMKEYHRLHEACPKCGATAYSSTYAGYILNMADTESYKDENSCVCSECGDRHITHDRVPINH